MSMPRELSFDGEVALVTGAGRGIGCGHALELARRGARIVVNDADGPVAKAVADEISAAGGQAVASHDSVATPAGGAAVVDHALDAFGQPWPVSARRDTGATRRSAPRSTGSPDTTASCSPTDTAR